MKKRAVFFDRDDTIIRNVPYLGDPRQVEILPGVAAALKRLQQAGYELFIVSNQSGVGRGLITRDQVAAVNREMIRQLGEPFFTEIYNSYASPEDPYCEDRKPAPLLVFRARDEHGLDLAHSFFVGDKVIDVQCAVNAGCHPVLVLTGTELSDSEIETARKVAEQTCQDVPEAVAWILSLAGKKESHANVKKTVRKPKVKARK
jgi:D-glycero-D-manno-heptose 1,7-bisphosphate phosphatase